MDLKEHGMEEKKRSLLLFVEKLHKLKKLTKLKFGAMVNKLDHFLYIDDCIEATRRLMNSDFTKPINIGSEEMVSLTS